MTGAVAAGRGRPVINFRLNLAPVFISRAAAATATAADARGMATGSRRGSGERKRILHHLKLPKNEAIRTIPVSSISPPFSRISTKLSLFYTDISSYDLF